MTCANFRAIASSLVCISGVKELDTVFWFEVIFALIRCSSKFRVRLNVSIGDREIFYVMIVGYLMPVPERACLISALHLCGK